MATEKPGKKGAKLQREVRWSRKEGQEEGNRTLPNGVSAAIQEGGSFSFQLASKRGFKPQSKPPISATKARMAGLSKPTVRQPPMVSGPPVMKYVSGHVFFLLRNLLGIQDWAVCCALVNGNMDEKPAVPLWFNFDPDPFAVFGWLLMLTPD